MSIRRPLAFVFLAYMLGIGSNYIFSPSESAYFLGIAFFCITSFISLVVDQSKMFTFILALLVLFNIGGLVCQKELIKKDPLAERAGTNVTYSGTVLKYQKKEKDFHKITVRNGSFDYLVYIYGEDVDPKKIIGNKVTFTGTVEKPPSRRNPGGFDYRLYLKSVNIRSIIECDITGIDVNPITFRENPLYWVYGQLADVKYNFLKTLEEYMSPETHGLLNGMLLGSKDGMDEDTYEAFQKNGIAHILSVSGIHVGIIYSFIYFLLGRRINIFTAGAILIFLFMYAFLSEFSPSVIRAVLMISIHIITKLLIRPYDLLTGTSLAALIMLIDNPLALFHVGFQLSFLAIILLSFCIPYIKRYVGKKKIIGVYKERFKDGGNDSLTDGSAALKKKTIEILMPLLVIQLGMAPFSIFIFNYFSVAGLFMNIPIIFISGAIIPLGVCLIPVSRLGLGVIGEFIMFTGAKSLDLLLSWMIKINDLVSELDISSFYVVSPRPWTLLIFYGLLFFFTSETFRILKNRKMKVPIGSVIVLVCIVALLGSQTPLLSRDDSDLVFVDVGQGDCIHVRTPSGKNILIDGGGSADYAVGKKTLMPYLLKNGVKKIDYVFVTHLHTDHFQGIRELSNEMDTGRLITYEGNSVNPDELTSGSGIDVGQIDYVGKGDRYNIEKDVYMDILYPDKKDQDVHTGDSGSEVDENDNTLFMKLHYKDISVLITGDLDEDGERLIISEYEAPGKILGSTILKVGHHGSKYSTSDEFLEYVDPEVSVIQVGKNNYGHPTPEVIEKLKEKDIMLYRNDIDGAIMIDHENGGLTIKKMINEE